MESSAMNQRKVGKNKNAPSKIDPSFKSKRYRDKLRTEVKALESLIPVDKPTLHRKLDSQTVYRLAIAYLRVKSYFKAVQLSNTKSAINGDEKVCVSPEHTEGSQAHDDDDEADDDVPGSNEVTDNLTDIDFFQPETLNQILDGFILVASVDGTVMYVSENILQFNGFNQVDLKHRCIYGAIHPDDQCDVRDILENKGTFTYQDPQSILKPARKKQKMKTDVVDSVPLAFFCRMKCFSGNAAGYLKLHCTGKIQSVPELTRTPRTSDKVVLLYCKPFLLNGSDIMHEAKQRMFWSKHELDLRFNDIEKHSTDIIGYEDGEICEKSLYQFVHPEDLCILVHVHKSITEINEVQSFYFRFQNKDGSWTWLHSKGKVICKNSKKFSIVFTHCPIRDEDSIFIQQEATLRRRYGLDDLINMNATKHVQHVHCKEENSGAVYQTKVHCMEDIHRNRLDAKNVAANQAFMGLCINEELVNIMNPLSFMSGHCPSTWHANSDRHSPVVPSSHVAHKLSIREKQLHLADFKRKQELSSQVTASNGCKGNDYLVHSVNQTWTGNNQSEKEQYRNGVVLHGIPVESNPGFRPYMTDYTDVQSYPDRSVRWNDGYNCMTAIDSYGMNRQFYYLNCFQSESFNYPPSPPPSPRMMYPGYDVSTSQLEHQLQSFNEYQYPHLQSAKQRLEIPDHSVHIQAHANIRVSMVCNPMAVQTNNNIRNNTIDIGHYIPNYVNTTAIPTGQTPSCCVTAGYPASHIFSANQMKREPEISQSCSRLHDCVGTPFFRESVQYDMDASPHMKIVETDTKANNEKAEVDMPVIESFMDYLNNAEG